MTPFWLQQLFTFLQIASFYLPLAVAFALIQAVTRRIFLSFGDLAMFGSFGAVYTAVGGMVHGFADWQSALVSLAASVACGAALGVVVARLVMGEKLLANPLAFMIASIGISIVVQEIMRLRTGSQDVWVPPLFGGMAAFDGADWNLPRLSMLSAWSTLAGLGAVIFAAVTLGYTRFGLMWQACSQSPKLASLCGVNAVLVATQSYALAGGLAGVTGWTSSIAYGGASFTSGALIGLKAMFASVVGGFGTLRGAIVGSLAFAAIEVLWSATFGASYRDVALFGIIIVCLMLKPEGLVGQAVERD